MPGAFAATRLMFAFITFSFHVSSAVGIVKTGSCIAEEMLGTLATDLERSQILKPHDL